MPEVEHAPELGKRLVDALHGAHGEHPGHRAAHAKGICCTGTFAALDEAQGLTRAEHMQGVAVPVTIRFSNGSGIPSIPDYVSDGRGMAVKFHLANGGATDMVGLTLPVFFVRNPEDFMEFLVAARRDAETRQPDLALLGAFLEKHPETQAALGPAFAPVAPASYVQVAYNGIHTFRLTNADGQSRWARYRWEPELGEETITTADARERGRDFLQDDLRARLANEPAGFQLRFILAAEGDPVIDPTQAWPEERESIVAGRLEVTAVDPAAGCDALMFDPTNVVDGIECSDDPILHARSVAYSRSFALRRGITAPMAAVPGQGGEVGARAREMAAALGLGELRAVALDGARVAVASVDGTLYAFQDTCTHRNCSLADGTLVGTIVTCPCHGSQFDVTSGAVVRGPAREALPTY
jgi:catalase